MNNSLETRSRIWNSVKQMSKTYNPKYKPVKYKLSDALQASHTKKSIPNRIVVSKGDSLDFPILNNIDNPLILIFADDVNPGGCIESGNGMQEETLFRRTMLVSYLMKNTDITIVPSELYQIKDDELIYCKDVPVLRLSETYNNQELNEILYYSFIACPCIKFPGMSMTEKEKKKVRNKIRLMIFTAVENHHKNLILGAWGCGAYGCDQKTMASLFKEVINEFPDMGLNFYFVILGKSFHIFNDVLS